MVDQPAAAVRRIGVGEFPRELDRVNWGALLLGPLWALLYSAWPWFFGLVAIRFSIIALYSVGIRYLWPVWPVQASLVALEVGYVVSSIVFAFGANRLSWNAANRKLVSASPERAEETGRTVTRYLADQRVLAWVGVALQLLPSLARLKDAHDQSDPRFASFAIATWLVFLAAFVAVWATNRFRTAHLERS